MKTSIWSLKLVADDVCPSLLAFLYRDFICNALQCNIIIWSQHLLSCFSKELSVFLRETELFLTFMLIVSEVLKSDECEKWRKVIFIYPVVCYRQTPWSRICVMCLEPPSSLPNSCWPDNLTWVWPPYHSQSAGDVIMNIHDARTPSISYRPYTHLLSRSDW